MGMEADLLDLLKWLLIAASGMSALVTALALVVLYQVIKADDPNEELSAAISMACMAAALTLSLWLVSRML